MFSSSSLDVSLRDAAQESKEAPVTLLSRLLLDRLAGHDHAGARHTLLAVCPNSEAVARAALLAAEEAQTPLLYAATLNQVDRDGGYTGWTPTSFSAFVEKEVDRLEITVPVFLGLDHGGPWAKDVPTEETLDGPTAMTEVQRSITACVKAGYDLLHLDPGAGPHGDTNDPLPIDAIVDRTIELLRHAENVRRAHERDPVAYEVGTDDARGGLDNEDRLRTFLERLRDKLGPNDLPRPAFVVGDLGTALDSDRFDVNRAHRFVVAVQDTLGALVKGHYTDGVTAPSDYPLAGVGGANVGPGLSAVEADAVRDLVSLEDRLGLHSGVVDAVRAAVIESGRWTKWLRPTEQGRSFHDLPSDRQRWLVDTGSRYVWSRAEVHTARTRLFENVAPYRNGEAYVHWRLKNAILRYMHAFNLINLNDHVESAIARMAT